MSFFSFELPKDFVASYAHKRPSWGYTDAGDNSLGEITFLRTYSRLKKDGSKEQWFEVCERVINGMYSLQKDHCLDSRLPWSDSKANESAMEAYDRMFNFKWTPPGRGLWVMGTPIVNEDRNSAALQNCAFVSTSDMPKDNPAKPFAFLMEASMLGVGVGFDNKGGDLGFVINTPISAPDNVFVIPDTREGWVDSVSMLINSFLVKDSLSVSFDYSLIRPLGAPIKTFGGTASGPDPLIKLHEHIVNLFSNRSGDFLSRTDIADLGNMIGVCVVSGNVRRSAELLIGSVDDEEFLNLKNYGSYSSSGDFTPGPASRRQEWGWMSNNSVEVKVGQDLSPIIDRVAHNGEPGVIWMDVSRQYGRLVDPPNNKDHRVAGYNPCVTSDTWVMTSEGPRQVRDLISQSFTAIVNGKPYSTISKGFWLTGADREVFDIVTDSGWSARVTGNHQILTSRGWVEAEDLETGDQIILNDHSAGTYWNGRGGISEGYLLGHLWGDGTLKDQTAVLSVWGEYPEMMTQIEAMASNFLRLRSDWKGFTKVPGRSEWRLRSADLAAVARSWGMGKGCKKITDEIEKGSWEFYRGFLQGAFDTDGHVEGNLDKGVSIRLSQSDEEQLQRVQRMLGRIGILSKIRVAHQEQEQNMPGGTYKRRQSFRLIISGAHASRYMELIGFLDDAKRSKWETLTSGMTAGFYYKKPVTSFVELVPAGRANVYDVTVSDVHAFDANGLYVHNCAEQSLESFEMCTLVETYLNRHDNLEDYKRTLKFAYLYAKTVTLLPTHWEETNAIMQRNRRIGTSMSGVANFADSKGLPTLRSWMDFGYKTIEYYDNVYSEWLCIRPSIKTTTVKPSGTVSILAGESPGVHWTPGGKFFLRAIRFANNDPMVDLFRSSGYLVEPAFESPDSTSVVFFPVKSDAARSDKDVSIFEKMNLAATAQRYWSDNSVSVTVSFDSVSESSHVATVLHMYDGQLKTVSFLPQGNDVYPQMPYTQISKTEFESYLGSLGKVDLSPIYSGVSNSLDALGEAYCTTDRCEIPTTPGGTEFEDKPEDSNS